jgi:hypothetical protein
MLHKQIITVYSDNKYNTRKFTLWNYVEFFNTKPGDIYHNK